MQQLRPPWLHCATFRSVHWVRRALLVQCLEWTSIPAMTWTLTCPVATKMWNCIKHLPTPLEGKRKMFLLNFIDFYFLLRFFGLKLFWKDILCFLNASDLDFRRNFILLSGNFQKFLKNLGKITKKINYYFFENFPNYLNFHENSLHRKIWRKIKNLRNLKRNRW